MSAIIPMEVSLDLETSINPVSGSIELTENGTFDVSKYAEAIVNVKGKTITGTFNTGSGTIASVDIPYDGDGYPIIVLVYPSEGGYNPDGKYYNALQSDAVGMYVSIKNYFDKSPSENTYATCIYRYKTNSTSATNYSTASTSRVTYSDTEPRQGITRSFYIRNNKNFSFWIGTLGLLAECDYDYVVVYSE